MVAPAGNKPRLVGGGGAVQPSGTPAGTTPTKTVKGPTLVEAPATGKTEKLQDRALDFQALLDPGRPGAAPAPAELRQAIAQALDVKTGADVRELGPKLRGLASLMVTSDLNDVLGSTPQKMLEKFGLAEDPLGNTGKMSSAERNRLLGAHALAKTLLEELADRTLTPVANGKFEGLDPKRLSTDRQGAVVAQHCGYVAGVLAREPQLKGIDRESARIVLRAYFTKQLTSTEPMGITDQRKLLAKDLASLSDDPKTVEAFVMSKEQDGLFSLQALESPSGVLANLASTHAGEATLELAAKLVGQDKAAAFVKRTFERPHAQLVQMLQDPQGPEGILLHFAATANQLGWEWAKLGSGYVDAMEKREDAAVAKFHHHQLGPSRKMMTEDPDAAVKLADQEESFLIHRGELIPIDRSGTTDTFKLHEVLDSIRRHGIYSEADGNLRVLSSDAARSQQTLATEVRRAAKVSKWQLGAEIAANTVSQMSSAFASQATGADFAAGDRMTKTFYDALGRLRAETDKLLENGPPQKGDEAYKALYQERAGEVSFAALHGQLGEQARSLVRNATFADLIPLALKNLRLPDQGEFSAKNLVADLGELKGTLLKDDYFLSQPEFMKELEAEVAKGKSKSSAKDLEMAVRLPNATWMWLLLVRGLVEDKLSRLEGSQTPDLGSDKFPDSVQFNPPDVRDVELFRWAKHRLVQEHDVEPQKATRMALSLVVLTLYKDLVQVRKGAAL